MGMRDSVLVSESVQMEFIVFYPKSNEMSINEKQPLHCSSWEGRPSVMLSASILNFVIIHLC